MQSYIKYKGRAITLRRAGKAYTEIQEIIKPKIPQSTLSDWFKHTAFSIEEIERIAINARQRIRNGHLKTLIIKKAKRKVYFQEIHDRLLPLNNLLGDPYVAKLALMMLYWCEGKKALRGSVSFGNSDPKMIRLFLLLMRKCYVISEEKFRATVQCRADQNPETLALYWSNITNIPLGQFYKPLIDPRTIGKPSKRLDYKGVCRIDYFSAKVYHELLAASSIF